MMELILQEGGMNQLNALIRFSSDPGGEPDFGNICYEAYQICIAHRSFEKHARAFITKSYRAYLLSRGAEERVTREMEGYYRHPNSHPAAGLF